MTLDELFVLYEEVIDKEIRTMQGMANAFGADIDINFGPKDKEEGDSGKNAFDNLMERIGQNKPNEFSNVPIGYTKI